MSQATWNMMYAAALKAQIVSLEARWNGLVVFAYNTNFQLEAGIVLKQIEALQTELTNLGEAL